MRWSSVFVKEYQIEISKFMALITLTNGSQGRAENESEDASGNFVEEKENGRDGM